MVESMRAEGQCNVPLTPFEFIEKEGVAFARAPEPQIDLDAESTIIYEVSPSSGEIMAISLSHRNVVAHACALEAAQEAALGEAQSEGRHDCV